MKKFFSLALGAVMGLTLAGCDVTQEMIDNVDMLGNPQAGIFSTAASGDYGDSFGAVNAVDEEKYVGIFYCLWMGTDTPAKQDGKKSVSDVYYGDNALEKFRDTAINGGQAYRYWGEPMYGYYRSNDEWVIRKHLQLLTLAGVDYLALDTTNALTYDSVLEVLLKVIAEYRGQGIDVPQVLFLTNSSSTQTALKLYNNFYTRAEFADCWFRGRGGKPWISCYTNEVSGAEETLSKYFYVKDPQWPTEAPKENGLPWIDWTYPQHAYTDSQVGGHTYAVAVAQHTGISNASTSTQFSDSAYAKLLMQEGLTTTNKYGMAPEDVYNMNHGRGYDFETGKNAGDDMDKIKRNINFAQQWETVLNDPDANMVMVLGWNEWIAGNWHHMPSSYSDLNAVMCDLVNLEFSRDVEMMADGENSYFDNCYLQLCRYIREFKGQGTGTAFLDANTASITEGKIVDSEWENAISYLTFAKSAQKRNVKDAFGDALVNTTGRNDIVSVKVAQDADNLYFLLETASKISDYKENDTHWMNIYIGTGDQNTGFNGLQYVLNRAPSPANGTTSLHKIGENDYSEVSGADCSLTMDGTRMMVRVSKQALGIKGSEFTLQFKVADNNSKDFDLTDWYTNGDVAPLGRVNYVYSAK